MRVPFIATPNLRHSAVGSDRRRLRPNRGQCGRLETDPHIKTPQKVRTRRPNLSSNISFFLGIPYMKGFRTVKQPQGRRNLGGIVRGGIVRGGIVRGGIVRRNLGGGGARRESR